jgi:hypothetical protein
MEFALASYFHASNISENEAQSHNETRGCLLDLCASKPDMRWKLKVGYVCSKHRAIFTRFGGDEPALEAIERVLDEVRRIALGRRSDAHLSGQDVFVSYASEDSEVATELRDGLEREGISCFMAGRDLGAGGLWEDDVRAAAQSSRALLLLLTPSSKNSSWVQIEAGAAWVLEKPIIPALSYVRAEELPEPIRKHQCFEAKSSEQRQQLVAKVVSRLRGES